VTTARRKVPVILIDRVKGSYLEIMKETVQQHGITFSMVNQFWSNWEKNGSSEWLDDGSSRN